MADDIFRISKDFVRAKDLFEMANERLNEIIPGLPKDKSYKIAEEYYEVVIQLITSLMYSDGFKTLGHVSLIEYLEKNYREFSKQEIQLIDLLRKIRHGTVYYGKKLAHEFLINNEENLLRTISKLNSVLKKKLK